MKNSKLFAIFLLLTVLCIAFIFGNSLKTAEESSKISDPISDKIASTLASAGVQTTPEEVSHPVRKSAHMLEFFALGICAACLASLGIGTKSFVSVPLCMLVAAIDELLQYFVPGRSCEFGDFCIDCGGAAIGILAVTLAVYLLVTKKKNQLCPKAV